MYFLKSASNWHVKKLILLMTVIKIKNKHFLNSEAKQHYNCNIGNKLPSCAILKFNLENNMNVNICKAEDTKLVIVK